MVKESTEFFNETMKLLIITHPAYIKIGKEAHSFTYTLKTEMTNKRQKKVSITVPETTTIMTSVCLFKNRQVYLVINLSVNNFY